MVASLSLLKKGSAAKAEEAKPEAPAKASNVSVTTAKKPDIKPVPATAKKPAPAPKAVEIKKPEPEPAPADPPAGDAPAAGATSEAVVDVDKMTAKQLDELVKDNQIETPDDWAKMTVGKKRDWLKSQFENVDTAGAEDVGDEVGKGETVSAEVEQPAPEPATKPSTAVATTKPKKAQAPAKALTGEVLPPDDLSDMVHEIENLKEKDAKGLVNQLAMAADEMEFKLGGVLSVIQANGWFGPYDSFKEYVEGEHPLSYRKAAYCIRIYNDITESKVPWEKVKHLGWSKLKDVAQVMTVDNVDQWVEAAEKHTTMQLADMVSTAKKQASSSSTPAQLEGPSATTVVTMTFKVHEDQKKTIDAALAKAKEQSQTDVNTVALEHICLDFLGGGKSPKLDATMKKAGLEKVFEAFESAFPDTKISVELPE
jgi:hypothetical protein